jgi:VanZ family protein
MFMREVYWAVSRRLLLLVVYVLVAAALLFVPLPISTTYAGRTIENAGHTPLFLIGTLAVLSILRHDLKLNGARLYALAGLIGCGAGFLSEVIQKPLHRDASWEDVFADATGAVCALALYALVDRAPAVRAPVRAAVFAVAMVCIAAYAAPIVSMTRAYLHRNGQFPVLANFDSGVELFWIVGYGIKREIKGGALDVTFDAEQFPGFSFHEPVPDWRPFKTLLIDVENPDSQVLQLGMRVHDMGHGRVFIDRFNRHFELAPGERRTLRIDLEEVRHGPKNRLMNMGQISDVTLFHGRPGGSLHMRLYSMRLE